jgi:hypothetical protein
MVLREIHGKQEKMALHAGSPGRNGRDGRDGSQGARGILISNVYETCIRVINSSYVSWTRVGLESCPLSC